MLERDRCLDPVADQRVEPSHYLLTHRCNASPNAHRQHLPGALVAEGASIGVASSIIARSALLSAPVILLCVYLYARWSTRGSLVLMLVAMSAGLVSLLLRGAGVPVISNPVFSVTLLVIGSSGVISVMLPYAAESYPIRIRGRATGWIAGCTKLGGLAAQVLSALTLVPALGIAATLVAIPAITAAALIGALGRETRGRDLRELERPTLRVGVQQFS